ncbi:MAG TPA: AgmX/PglI C-terminal domain-containing protein [Gemmatimonadaceae bacterium]|nr:AgmX/PglI C-terminal domain-containing protein [Gemmatimonadaceae bacterium]
MNTEPATVPARPRRPNDNEALFSRSLRYEFASEEGRALVGSYAISIALATAFLLLVYLMPVRTENPFEKGVTAPIAVNLDPLPLPEVPTVPQAGETETVAEAGPTVRRPGPRGPQPGSARAGRPGSPTEATSAGAIGRAFGASNDAGAGGMVGDVSGILRGVDVSSGAGGAGGGLGGTGGGGAGGKTVLGYGQGGQGSRTPGRGGIGGGAGAGGGGGGGIGGVGGGGGLTAARVRVSAPAVVASDLPGGPGRDVSELGTFVRSRESQLRFCYVEQGLKVNPNLAGTVTVAVTLTGGGNVTGVNITNRSWSGPGASEAESCIRNRVREWRFPAGDAGGTYSFPFNFTH